MSALRRFPSTLVCHCANRKRSRGLPSPDSHSRLFLRMFSYVPFFFMARSVMADPMAIGDFSQANGAFPTCRYKTVITTRTRTIPLRHLYSFVGFSSLCFRRNLTLLKLLLNLPRSILCRIHPSFSSSPILL